MLVGYSNGGALVLKYAMDEVERGGGLRPARLVLVSPMIGVAPFAWVARVVARWNNDLTKRWSEPPPAARSHLR